MEIIILGWYVLVETQSVLMLSVFGALQYLGTLFAPMSGILGHRIGNKRVICTMRCLYMALALTLMTLALTGVLMPVHVFIFGTLLGLFRPSDLVMRYALIGQTIPSEGLLGATSISRTTQDSARVIGALSGAGISAALGIGYAYLVIAFLYGTSLALSLNVAGRSTAGAAPGAPDVAVRRTSPWRDLLDVLKYVWDTPRLLAAMWIAFLVNVSAFPFMTSLMPYVAKEIYHTGQAGVGYLVASFAGGALIGSIALSRYGGYIRPGRMILAFCVVWYLLILVFVLMPGPASGCLALMLCGLAQSLCLVPLSAMLLKSSDERYRGGVMGVRQLMIYGVPIGLLAAGPSIERFGFAMTATIYGVLSLAVTLWIGLKWRSHLWRLDAPANAR
jgi:predicted MFS family arabinose efflux permease